VRNPLVDEHDQLLAATHRSEAQGSGLRQVPQQVVAALARGSQASLLPHSEQFAAPQLSITHQRLHGELVGTLERERVQAELSAAGGGTGHHAWRGDAQHPGQILGDDKVQGAPHRPRLDDLAGVHGRLHTRAGACCGAQRNRGEDAVVVLSLQGGHPAHGVGRGGASGTGDSLRHEPEQSDFAQGRHGRPPALPPSSPGMRLRQGDREEQAEHRDECRLYGATARRPAQ